MYIIDSYGQYAASALTSTALVRYLAAGGIMIGFPTFALATCGAEGGCQLPANRRTLNGITILSVSPFSSDRISVAIPTK